MKIQVFNTASLPAVTDRNALVVFQFEDDPAIHGPRLPTALRSALEALVDAKVITGGKPYLYPCPSEPHCGVLVLGLGKREAMNRETLRRAAGDSLPLLKTNRVDTLTFDATGNIPIPVKSFIEGLVLSGYTFDRYKKATEESPWSLQGVTVAVAENEATARHQSRYENAVTIAQCANFARDLGNRSGNDLSPTQLAACAVEIAQEGGLACTILDEDTMAELGMNALLGVSRGSAEPAKLILLEYKHPDAKETIALVGKGLTFDCGGISIKPSEGLDEMKFDMCGGAAVLGAMKAIAALKPAINVVAAVPSSENMTGDAAQRPGDIVTAYNGKSIDVKNTDAEGRLILADAMAYVVDTYKPARMVDLATLTGACVVALGSYAAGMFTNDDTLVPAFQKAADKTGDRLWHMPLWDDYCELIKGNHADLHNIGPNRWAGAITAAAFLKEFVGDTPWVHLDIAGTAWDVKGISYLNPKHATGYGVRLLTEWVTAQAETP